MTILEAAARPAVADVVEVLNPGVQREWEMVRTSGLPSLLAGYNLCMALFGLERAGIAALLRDQAVIPAAALQGERDAAFTAGLLHYLEIREVVERGTDGWALTEQGRMLLSAVPMALLGYYHEAYAPVLREIGPLVRGEVEYGRDVARDGAALGEHCEVLFRSFGTDIVAGLLKELGTTCLLDLGCGSGGFLIDLCQALPGLSAVGVDISEPVIRLGRERVARAGKDERITLRVGDAFRPETWPAECAGADTFITVGTLHEHFREGEDAVVELLDRYAALLEGGRGLILGEPELYRDRQDADFYLIHTFTRQGYPRRREEWMRLFERTRLRCERMYHAPNTGFRFVYFHLVHA